MAHIRTKFRMSKSSGPLLTVVQHAAIDARRPPHLILYSKKITLTKVS
jgi:hypothetical protein